MLSVFTDVTGHYMNADFWGNIVCRLLFGRSKPGCRIMGSALLCLAISWLSQSTTKRCCVSFTSSKHLWATRVIVYFVCQLHLETVTKRQTQKIYLFAFCVCLLGGVWHYMRKLMCEYNTCSHVLLRWKEECGSMARKMELAMNDSRNELTRERRRNEDLTRLLRESRDKTLEVCPHSFDDLFSD